jgi:hypothetical protein
MSKGGNYTRRERVQMAKKGWAITITNDKGEVLDGACPIANKDDLKRAIANYKVAKNKPIVRAHIKKRAGELGVEDVLPASWRRAPAKRRGRPVGAPSLTRDRQETILGLIRKGVLGHVAASAAGVSPRSLREWVSRGEGRSTRPSTPKLRNFAKEFRKAEAEARALAEARAYEDHLLAWLRHAAPSKSGLPGWTDMPEGSEEGEPPTHDEVLRLLRGVFMDLLLTDATLLVPDCGNRRCMCRLHRIRTPEELERTRRIAARLRKEMGGGS